MGTLTSTVEDVGNLVERALRADMKDLIKKKILASIDQMIEEMAIEIADNIVVNAESFKVFDPTVGFGPETRVVINFNLKEPNMVYDTKTKEVKRRDIIKR